MLNKLIFDHSADDFFTAVGIAEHHYDIAHYTTIYHMLSPMVTSALLDVESEPLTKSKILENTLLHIRKNNIADQETALLLAFERTYIKTMERLKVYRDVLKDKFDSPEFVSGSIAMGAVRGEDLGDAIRNITKMIEARPIAQMVEVLKETSCNYDKFIQFTVDEVDMRVVTGQMTQEEVDRENDDDSSSEDDVHNKIKQLIKNAGQKKKPADEPKNYDDIDDIIRRAFESDDED